MLEMADSAPDAPGGGRPVPPPVVGRKDVDLNDPALYIVERRLPAWSLPAAVAASLLICGGITAWIAAGLSPIRTEVAELESRAKRLQGSTEAAPADGTQALQAEIAKLKLQLAQLEGGGDSAKVSTVLDALASAAIDGVWLTRIRFDRTVNELRLEGRTRDARLLPQYLQALGRQAPFKGMALATLDAQRPEAASGAGPSPVSFKIVSARADGAPPEGDGLRAERPLERVRDAVVDGLRSVAPAIAPAAPAKPAGRENAS